MRCYHKILHISYKDHVTNEEVRAKIQQAIGLHKVLLTMVKRCKLRCYGHVSCSSGLAKTILQGTANRGRRQGTWKKRWEHNIRKWTGLEFAKSQRAVENREELRKLVVKSSVVPHWRPLLRDRCRWRWRCFEYCKRICTESWLLKKNPLPHRGVEPASAVCQSATVTTELQPQCIVWIGKLVSINFFIDISWWYVLMLTAGRVWATSLRSIQKENKYFANFSVMVYPLVMMLSWSK